MQIRMSHDADIPGILALQEQNLLINLPAEQQGDGFIITPFTPELISELSQQQGVFVAAQEDRIIAYVFAGSWDFYGRWPIFPLMVSLLPSWQLAGQPLEAERTFQYGPVVVDRQFRGQQVLPKLFEVLRSSFAPRYRHGVTFINKRNPRSFAAHTQKLNWQVVGEFEFNNGHFHGLAHDLKRSH